MSDPQYAKGYAAGRRKERSDALRKKLRVKLAGKIMKSLLQENWGTTKAGKHTPWNFHQIQEKAIEAARDIERSL